MANEEDCLRNCELRIGSAGRVVDEIVLIRIVKYVVHNAVMRVICVSGYGFHARKNAERAVADFRNVRRKIDRFDLGAVRIPGDRRIRVPKSHLAGAGNRQRACRIDRPAYAVAASAARRQRRRAEQRLFKLLRVKTAGCVLGNCLRIGAQQRTLRRRLQPLRRKLRRVDSLRLIKKFRLESRILRDGCRIVFRRGNRRK